MSVVSNGNTLCRRAPMATQEEDPPDNEDAWKTCNGESNGAVEEEGELITCGGKPLSPGASYIFLKNDLSNVARLEDFDQEKIATGFFSEVYKVSHIETGKVMVLKKNVQQFNRPNVLQEIQLLNQLHHPNIIKFLGVCIAEGQLHALTEYVNHGSLRQVICDDNTMFPWPIRLGMAQDIADGMSYLHRLRIVHRDLTSLNCLIKKRGHELSAIVSDLGLAIKLPENSEEELSIVGSPFWIAPECLHGKLYNETADIFSYGIILCEMIARITADPEDLPRLENFGLDDDSFRAIVSSTCPSCPEAFLQLAVSCCKMTPTVRPAFKNIVIKIENIAAEYNTNNNDTTKEGYPYPRKSRSQSSVQPPRVNFHTTCISTTRHRHQQTRKIMRSSSDAGPRPDITIRQRSQVNPFNTPDLQGGHVKLMDSSTDSTKPYSLELETLDDVSLLLMQGRESAPIEEKRGRMTKRISQSLPSSPEMNRKIKQDEENSFVEELEDQEFEDTFLQDRPVDLTQPRRRSLLIREYSLPITWREDLKKKPRSRSSENFSKRLDSGLSSFGDEDAEMMDGMSHLQLDEGIREVFEPVKYPQIKNIGKHTRSDTR